jgi:outer membrane protein TolC
MLHTVKILVVVALLLLAGCAQFDAQPLAADQNAAQFEERSFADPALTAFIEKNMGSGFDPGAPRTWELETLTLAAFYFQPELDVARAQWAVAEAGRISAGERPNPTLGLTPAYNSTTGSPSPRIVTATINLTLQTAGKRGYRIAQAAQLSEAARLNIASVAWQVRARVWSGLLDLYGAREAESLLAQQQSIHAANLRILEVQYREGAISAFELTQARLAADGARLALHDAKRQTAEARVRLADALGVPANALDGIEFGFERFTEPPADVATADVRRQALLNRSDILSALAGYAASQAKLQLEIANQYPDIQLGPGYEYDQGDNKWSLGIALALPVFNRNQGAIAEAQARRAESAAQFDALQARVLGEIDLAVAGLRTALDKQADANAMLAELTRQENAARSMLEVGEISGSELAALQLQLSVSMLARLDAQLQAQRAAGQLEVAVQSSLGLPDVVWQDSPRISGATGAKGRP